MLQKISGNIVNIYNNSTEFGEISIFNGRIFNIKLQGPVDPLANFIIPGFVDAHVHIESSMLTPTNFGKAALEHGTVATVSDPHEIANVLGINGIDFMINDAKNSPVKFHFGAPSCVPATSFETAGAVINADDINLLMQRNDIWYLAEMMNFPGVINDDKEILLKIEAAKKYNKPIDGHAPQVSGQNAIKYFNAGISTDHECSTYEEALEKLKLGVKILIREGSAAKNFEALIPLAKEYSHLMMFCSDDKHPDDLIKSHINFLVKWAVNQGVDAYSAIRMASFNPVKHYKLDVGLLKEGDHADFIEIDNLENFGVKSVYINGVLQKETNLNSNYDLGKLPNKFSAEKLFLEDIKIEKPSVAKNINVIQVIDGQIITENLTVPLTLYDKTFEEWLLENNIQKLVVYNRYRESLPAVAFVKGFNIKEGALASTVAHDSHNIIAVGNADQDIIDAINRLIMEKGGICALSAQKLGIIPLPIAGLMSDKGAEEIAADYQHLNAFVKETLSCTLHAPFMTLSFLALLVIPALKLSDKGLFDSNKFEFSSIFSN